MATPSVDELRAFWGRRDDATNAVARTGIDLLANGEPVTPATFAPAMGISIDDARAYIDMARSMGAEVEGDAVVGMALTLRPTAHRFRVRGNDLYTWCGFDALFLPIMLTEVAQVASTCPVTSAPIQLTVHADGTASEVVPNTAVVGVVGEDVVACCPVSGPESPICTQMPLFASRQAGERWLTGRPGVAIIDLDDARDIARAYVERPEILQD